MASWKTKALITLHRHLEQQTVLFTGKATNKLAALELYVDDALEIMGKLTATDLVERIQSTSSGERLYVFKPHLERSRLYVKVALRSHCDVISFHPDSGKEPDEQG